MTTRCGMLEVMWWAIKAIPLVDTISRYLNIDRLSYTSIVSMNIVELARTYMLAPPPSALVVNPLSAKLTLVWRKLNYDGHMAMTYMSQVRTTPHQSRRHRE